MKLLLGLLFFGLSLFGQVIPTAFTSLPVCTVLDTRLSAPQLSTTARSVAVAGFCGVPANATSYALTFSIITPQTLSLTAVPINAIGANPRTLTFTSSGSASLSTTILAGPTGLMNLGSSVPTNAVIQITGFYAPEDSVTQSLKSSVISLTAQIATLTAQLRTLSAGVTAPSAVAVVPTGCPTTAGGLVYSASEFGICGGNGTTSQFYTYWDTGNAQGPLPNHFVFWGDGRVPGKVINSGLQLTTALVGPGLDTNVPTEKAVMTAIANALAAFGLTTGTGTQGPVGPMGPPGVAGVAGPQGLNGPAGPTGATGLTGATGAQGAAGLAGVNGSAGPMGPMGPQGPAGGSTGTTGGALPALTGVPGYLMTNGTSFFWGNITTGNSGMIDCVDAPGSCDIVPGLLGEIWGLNTWKGANDYSGAAWLRITSGAGIPTTGCASITDVAKVYIRNDANAPQASFYSCDNTGLNYAGAPVYTWELHP